MGWKWFSERTVPKFLGAAVGAGVTTAFRDEVDRALIAEAWRFIAGGLGAVALILAFFWFQERRRLARPRVNDERFERATVRALAERSLGIANATDIQLRGQPVVLMGRVLDVDDYLAKIKTRGGEEIGVKHRPEDAEFVRTLRRGDAVKVEGKVRYIIRDTTDHVMVEGAIGPPGDV
ncbi:MAG: hypothetical protein F4Z65_05730 [Acidobacteria bacterium]|nr:hypothetical protein [Acidobacteriota bacterium]MYA47394.1 hypothetical protein [Acidobacteriota bacterium]MYI37887.1 hypothetical protein [Acidobacteriota bacterium]